MFEENLHEGQIDAIRLKLKSSDNRGALKKTLTSTIPISDMSSYPLPPLRPARSKLRRPLLRRPKFWLGIVVVGVLGLAAIYGLWGVRLLQKIFQDQNPLSLFTSFSQFITAPDRQVTGEQAGEVNILLLGIGGEGHEGALLTDTMILGTLYLPKDKQDNIRLALVSIPRDYQARLPAGLEWRKINSAYAYGELGGKKLGAQWAVGAVEELSGKRIPYYALVDFSGFKKAIDDLGGVDVEVERSFSDSLYPNATYGYLPTVRFEKGPQHMDGERALQFSRSRHGTNGEGSDFARSRRQEKVLAAMKDKALQLNFTTDLPTISKLLENFANHFRTDLQPWEMKRLYDLIRQVKREDIASLALDPTTGLICSQIAQDSGAYILTACPGKTKTDLAEFFKHSLQIARMQQENSRLQIQNSTKSNGLAQKAKWAIETAYMETSLVNYPLPEALSQTLLYDLTGGDKPQTLAYLQKKFGTATTAAYPNPEKLVEPKPDFIVVLGNDAVEKFSNVEPPKPRRIVKEPLQSETKP